MFAVLLMLAALAAVVCWLCMSWVRLGAAGVAVLVAYPVPTLAVTVLVAVGLTVAAVALVARSVRADGWHLVTVHRPNLAPVGGVAS